MSEEMTKLLKAGLEVCIIRLHVEYCKECKEKYNEILNHALKETDKLAKKMPV